MNRKKRNLRYIRTKNSIRRGLSLFTAQKVTSELDNVGTYIAIDESKELSNLYKLPLKLLTYSLGRADDDFIKDLFTFRLEYKIAR